MPVFAEQNPLRNIVSIVRLTFVIACEPIRIDRKRVPFRLSLLAESSCAFERSDVDAGSSHRGEHHSIQPYQRNFLERGNSQ